MSRPTQDTTRNNSHIRIRDYHPLWFNFPVDSTSWNISHRGPTTPTLPKQDWFGLFRFRSPLLSESLIIFSSSGYLDVSVPQVRLIYLCIQYMIPASGWVSPFGNLRIKVCLPTPRSLSQAPTSFIASNCQGIHRMHLVA